MESGFSLLEVIVAFTIAAMALGIVFQIMGRGAIAATVAEEHARAVAVAESQLALARARVDADPDPTGSDGQYIWSVAVEPYLAGAAADEDDPLPLDTVRVEVRWQSRGSERSLQLESLIPGRRG